MHPQDTLEHAVLNTILYADIFQYPLTEEEIYRYLIGVKSSQQAVHEVLQVHLSSKGLLAQCGPYYLLPGKEEIVQTRLQRAQSAACMWPKAYLYGRIMAQIPFVRMVAVTGSLAMNNVDYGGDLDYLVVTRTGRLWLARGMVILLVRYAAQSGDRVCPNYFLSQRVLPLPDQNIFSAHELAQMVPLAGMGVYAALRQANRWAGEYLPNASGAPKTNFVVGREENNSWIQRIGESLLQNPAGSLVETWEMQRKLRKLRSRAVGHAEAQFGPDFCKGHLDDHEERVLHAYSDRLHLLERIST